ncbi:protein phosphatase [Kibdelosporangium banguiense]|uniref:Protein phosphatase n=1 Tax=Kibdelosporangium banguiense TaxID=1365924 RepID=A0ABS4TCM2_9PSEU|nr:PP2C family serine/threonine-protein phosphatase [Kibdelosporangium banguiense]MBP2321815.1 protein phosphatase [Kibdelosporangium banguiense]
MTLAIKYAARSDRGLHRSNNEDSVYAGPHLLAIADGMGGHAAGEVASKVVIAALAPLDENVPGDDLLGKLHEAVVAGNDTIAELVNQDPDLEGMGTTLTAILFGGGRLGLVNIGDSRTYLLREGQFSQITRDDSFVQSLLDEGRITPEEALVHPQRSLVLRALVGHETIEPTLQVRETKVGDRYLLCSDGLSDVVGFEKLAETMQISDRQSCADKMIELALQGGGPDNVTVIVADVVDEEPQLTQAFGPGTDNHMHPVANPNTSPPRPPVMQPPPQPPQQQMQQPPGSPQAKKKRGRKIAILAAAAVVLIALAGAGVRYLAYTNYYVAVGDAGEISVFQGVRGTVLGLELHRKVEGSCPPGQPACQPLNVSALPEADKTKVNEGLPVANLDAARSTIDTWRDQKVQPQCPQTSTTLAPTTLPGQTTTTTTTATTTTTTTTTTVADTNIPNFPGETTTTTSGQPANC